MGTETRRTADQARDIPDSRPRSYLQLASGPVGCGAACMWGTRRRESWMIERIIGARNRRGRWCCWTLADLRAQSGVSSCRLQHHAAGLPGTVFPRTAAARGARSGHTLVSDGARGAPMSLDLLKMARPCPTLKSRCHEWRSRSTAGLNRRATGAGAQAGPVARLDRRDRALKPARRSTTRVRWKAGAES
jgi:hypothetical protein